MSSPARILMCPPDHYGIEYEINPWMSTAAGAARDVAAGQWAELRQTLQRLGAEVQTLAPQPGLPDMVFTANAGLVFGRRFFSSAFRHGERAGEVPFFDEWFAGQGFAITHMPEGKFFEGAGDSLFCGEVLYGGYPFRSDAAAHLWIGEQVGVRVLPLGLVDPRFYHLDTCFCPVAADLAIYYPGAFDEYARRVLKEEIPRLIEVEEGEAARFACNAVVLGDSVVHNAGCPKLDAQLAGHGYAGVPVPLDEFIKAGGAAKCLTIRADGEDAAGWRNVT